MEQPAGVGPGQSLVFVLSKLGFAASRSFAACLEAFALEPRHFALLNSIALTEGQSQQALATALEIPPSRVVAIVDDLEARGLVERRPNRTDRRARALHLTASGTDLLHDARAAVRANEAEFCATLGPGVREQLLALLGPLVERQGLPFAIHPALTSTRNVPTSSLADPSFRGPPPR